MQMACYSFGGDQVVTFSVMASWLKLSIRFSNLHSSRANHKIWRAKSQESKQSFPNCFGLFQRIELGYFNMSKHRKNIVIICNNNNNNTFLNKYIIKYYQIIKYIISVVQTPLPFMIFSCGSDNNLAFRHRTPLDALPFHPKEQVGEIILGKMVTFSFSQFVYEKKWKKQIHTNTNHTNDCDVHCCFLWCVDCCFPWFDGSKLIFPSHKICQISGCTGESLSSSFSGGRRPWIWP